MKEEEVKIIPKPKPKISVFVNLLFWFSLILLIVLGGLYFLLQNQISSLAEEKEKIEEDMTLSPSQEELKKEMQLVSNKISDFSEIFEGHKITSNFFKFLKIYCHPKVQFMSLRIDSKQTNADLQGETENFRTLGEQILILKQVDFIKGLQVSNISLTQTGKVSFSLTFTFSEELIKK